MDADGSRSTTQQNTNKTARFFLAPLIGLERGLSALLKKSLGANYADVTEDEVRDLVDALANDDDEDGIEENSATMIKNIFEFDGLTAADVMTHRTAISGVDINTITLDDLIYLALDMGYSRIPVYEDSIDKIIGIIVVKDLLCLVGKTDLSDFDIRDFIRDVSFIPEACPCSDVFNSLNDLKSGMAVVVDEYGGTAGIITLEDIIEEIVGNIQDEYDDEKSDIVLIEENVYEVAGEADPDAVFKLFDVELPEDHEYETVSGFITDKLGYIPEGGEYITPSVDYEGVHLEVTSVEDRTILKVRVSRIPSDDAQSKEKSKEQQK